MYVVGLVQFSRELCKQQGSMAGLLISGVRWYTHPVPQFRAVHSETFIADTGYTGHLFMNECEVLPATIELQGRITSSVTVTVANLDSVPSAVLHR
jgi:hypothetical protein